MPSHGLDESIIAKITELRRKGSFQKDIAIALGIGQSTVNRHLKEAAKKGELGFAPVLDGFKIKSTSKKVDGAWVKQVEDNDVDFVPPDGFNLKFVTADTTGDGKIIHQYQRWEPAKPGTLTRDDLLDIFGEYRGKSELIPLPALLFNHDLTTVYTTSDLHLGMLAWGRETGVPWDLKIARDVIYSSMTELVQCSPPAGTAILLDLGDYTHNNNQQNVTPGHHHQLDVDGRFRKIAREAIKLRMDMIELLLQKHERVIVRSLPGNHDPDVAQILSAAFGIFFENNDRVEVDDDPSEFWCHEFGVNMLFANHGHKTKPAFLPRVMAGRYQEIWGRTKVKQAWSGHIHHETSGEDMGAKWKTLRTAAPGDSFAHSHGYVAGRELNSYTYHRERGFRQEQVVQIF